jgi:16S rRNA (cytosine967-C5)-methyltransferase
MRGLDAAAIAALASGDRHAPAALTDDERARLAEPVPTMEPAIAADVPAWLWPAFDAAFGDQAVAEGVALATRAPIDIRVNDLKITRSRLARDLAHLHPVETPHSPDGLRFVVDAEGRGPSLQTEKAFLDGLFEIQDEGSQLAARLSGARAGMTVVDLCAGAGGKTLSLAALMDNRGQIFASDVDSRRLAPLYERLKRSGARNVQVRAPKGRADDPLADLDGSVDLVFVDAPCTGSGTWRRNPDAKWRLRPGALAERIKEQAAVLDRAARLVRPGGRIAYVTCSVLPDENDTAVEGLLARHPELRALAPAVVAESAHLASFAGFSSPGMQGLQLSPKRCGVDGFFVSVVEKPAH